MQIRAVEFAETGHAEQAERARHLVLDELAACAPRRPSRRRERVALQAAEADQIGAERDRLDDVGAAAEAAVDDDAGASGHRLDDFRQHIHGAAAMIELTAAVVGDVDRVDAVIERDLGVLRGGDALEASGMLNLLLMRSTVRQSSAA